MADHGYHHRAIAVGQNPVQGHALRHGPYGFEWSYAERGEEQVEQVFHSERDAVHFAMGKLRHSSTAREHLVGFLRDLAMRDALIAELDSRGISHRHDSIPYGGKADPRYRVYVWGRDIDRCRDLSDRFIAAEAR